MTFPVTRPRRLRMKPSVRDLVRETRLSPGQLVYPLFVCPGEGVRNEISSMPGNYQMSVDALVEEVRTVKSLGVGGHHPVRYTRNEGRAGELRLRR